MATERQYKSLRGTESACLNISDKEKNQRWKRVKQKKIRRWKRVLKEIKNELKSMKKLNSELFWISEVKGCEIADFV